MLPSRWPRRDRRGRCVACPRHPHPRRHGAERYSRLSDHRLRSWYRVPQPGELKSDIPVARGNSRGPGLEAKRPCRNGFIVNGCRLTIVPGAVKIGPRCGT